MNNLPASLRNGLWTDFSFPSQIPKLHVVGPNNVLFPSGVLSNEVLQLIVDVLNQLNLPESLETTFASRVDTRKDLLSNTYTVPDWISEVSQRRFTDPLLVIPPNLQEADSLCSFELVSDFATRCSFGMVEYFRGLETTVNLLRTRQQQIHVRIESFDIMSAYLLYNGNPVPSHLITLCVLLSNAWKLNRDLPLIYLSNIESRLEAAYATQLLSVIEDKLNSLYKRNLRLQCVLVVENIYCALDLDSITYNIRKYITGIIVSKLQCWTSCYNIVNSNIDIIPDNFYNSLCATVMDICGRRKITPIASSEFCFSTSELGASLSRKHSDIFSHQLREQLQQGWQTCLILNKDHIPIARSVLYGSRPNTLLPSSNTSLREFLHQLRLSRFTHVSIDQLESSINTLLQTLTSFLVGEVQIPFSLPDSSEPKLIDSTIIENERRKIAQILLNQIPIRVNNGEIHPNQLFNKVLGEVFQRICHGVGCPQVEQTLQTKIAYDSASELVSEFFQSHESSQQEFIVFAYKNLIYPFFNNPALLQRYLQKPIHKFLSYPNVAIGGEIIFCTNQSFAPASNLTKSDFPSFVPKTFGAQGQVYDGWETRRHNMFPPDYVIIKLCKPSRIFGVNIDTAHFFGNFAPGASVLGLQVTFRHNRYQEEWVSLVDAVELKGNSRHFFPTKTSPLVQYVRLNCFPDGGIARLELFGETVDGEIEDHLIETHDALWKGRMDHYFQLLPKKPGFPESFIPPPSDPKLLGKPNLKPPCFQDPPKYEFPDLFNFAGSDASVIAGSSTTYSMPGNILRPGRGKNMGDGWETARIRCNSVEQLFKLDSPVFDQYNWVIIKLQRESNGFSKVVVDTLHFVNNSPIAFSLDGAYYPEMTLENYHQSSIEWFSLMPPTRVKANEEQLFDTTLVHKKISHVQMKIFPCGGISRLRLYGPITTKSSL